MAEVFLRPDFEKKTFNNDLALVKLTDPVSPSCFDHQYCIIVCFQYVIFVLFSVVVTSVLMSLCSLCRISPGITLFLDASKEVYSNVKDSPLQYDVTVYSNINAQTMINNGTHVLRKNLF